ncbi:MAG: hypothetical protein LBN22_01800 [Clostridiales Family XIII bacterium]|jgi:protein-tyrosine phosphatase|nr:hypothetical protein [Clostridiales Family XIII bacterium]
MTFTTHSIKYIDFHTHVLPGIDDGANDIETSISMLSALQAQGVDTVCITPHYYPHKGSYEDFLRKRKDCFERIQPRIHELGLGYVLAAETFLNEYLFNVDNIDDICMFGDGGRKYLLTEIPWGSSFSDSTLMRIEKLMHNYNVTPVLAHLERYDIFSDRDRVGDLLDMGCLIQSNCEAIKSKRFGLSRMMRYIDDNYVQVIGTDTHNMSSRKPNFDEGLTQIRKALGDDTIDSLMNNARTIVSESIILA